MSDTPISNRHAGYFYAHRHATPILDDMVAMERELNALRELAESLAQNLELVLTTTSKWNESVQSIIGRQPQTGIETEEPSKALLTYREKYPATL